MEYHQKEKEKDVARKRVSRMKLKGRYKRKHERELQATQQKRYRERKKVSKSDQEPQTQKQDRKSYFRSYRAKKRKEMSRQKCQAIKTEDRVGKHASKTAVILQSPDEYRYAKFVDDLIEQSSPRKKSKLMEGGIRTNNERTSVETALKGVKNLFQSMKKKRASEVRGVKSHR